MADLAQVIQYITPILSFLSFGFVVIISIVLGRNIREIDFGKFFKIRSGPSGPVCPQVPHAPPCPHIADAANRQGNIIRTVAEIQHIKTIEYREKAMDLVEQTITDIVGLMYAHFLKIFKERKGTGTGIVNDIEARAYYCILHRCFEGVRARMRYKVRENGFSEKVEGKLIEGIYIAGEWDRYVERTIDELSRYVTEFLNEHYYPASMVEREALYDHNLELKPTIEALVRTAMIELRRISIRYKALEEAKAEELDQYMIRIPVTVEESNIA